MWKGERIMSAITYKCPNCDGGLVFDPESGTYACEYCLSKFTQEELFGESQTSEAVQTEATIEGEKTQQSAVMYHCPSCGAEIIADSETSATFCVYCGNTAILQSKLSGKFSPDLVIPFKKTKEEAIETFKGLSKGRPLMPKGFNDEKNIEIVYKIKPLF